MSSDSVSDAAQQFFGGNFHQDWMFDADDWLQVVDNFVVHEDSEALLTLSQDIDNLRRAHSEQELDTLMLNRAYCYYDPAPETYNEWLGKVAERLREHAVRIQQRDSTG